MTRSEIANQLRRSARRPEKSHALRQKLSQFVGPGITHREMYQSGFSHGHEQATATLADVLFAVQEAGLGRASVIEESNRHLLVRIFDCSTSDFHGDVGVVCPFAAGFLAGALTRTGRYKQVDVSEVSCSQFPGRTCVFRAELQRS